MAKKEQIPDVISEEEWILERIRELAEAIHYHAGNVDEASRVLVWINELKRHVKQLKETVKPSIPWQDRVRNEMV